MVELTQKLKGLLSKGHERSVQAKKNILISLLIKGISIAVGLAIVPLTIKYVNPLQYGIWLTLSSIISWFTFFDVGLGNGLKNKLAESNALNQTTQSQIYVSTTYAILAIISSGVFIFVFLFNRYIPWQSILNIQGVPNINNLVLVVLGIFCMQFLTQLLNVVLTASHATSKVALIALIGQCSSLAAIWISTHGSSGSLLKLILFLAAIPLLVQLIANLWYYNTAYRIYKPSIKSIQFKYAKDLLGVGGAFFVIQIGALILFQTDNIVITQIYGPSHVTTFNVVYKYFSVISIVLNIIMTPLWSAFTEAYAKNDTDWIKVILSKVKKLWMLLVLVTIIMLLASQVVYKLWLKDSIYIPLNLSFAMAFYVITYGWQTVFVFFLNGIGKIRLQLYCVLISSCVNIPFAILLGKHIGVAGVTLSNGILFMIMGTLFYIQTNKILNKTATGIFNK